MSDLSFGSPWLLLLLPAAPLLALLPYWWKRGMGPVGMRYADTRLVSGMGTSLRLRVMPFVPGLRFLALALVIIAVARPQSGEAREVIRGEGGGHSDSVGHIGEHGGDGLSSAPVGCGEADHFGFHFGAEVRSDRLGGLFAGGVHAEPADVGSWGVAAFAWGRSACGGAADSGRDGDWQRAWDGREYAKGFDCGE